MNSSAYGYTPTSRYALRASPNASPQGDNLRRGTNVTAATSSLDVDEVPDTNTPPPFPITTPYRASCGHIYCYFCLSEKMIRSSVGDDADEDDSCWECLRCKQRVTSAERVLEIDDGSDEGVYSQDNLSDVDRDAGVEVVDMDSAEV